jgi:hypothetical protein
MIEFFIGCTAAYIFFRVLDFVFRSRRAPNHVMVRGNKKRIAIQDTHGDWYICEEQEPDTSELSDKIEVPAHQRPNLKVVK